MYILKNIFALNLVATAVVTSSLLMPATAQAGGYVFARSNPDRLGLTTHPSGYNGTGGTLNVNVCIVPGVNDTEMEQSIKNNIAIWNKNQSTTSNLRTTLPTDNGTAVDFESVALHELGHCVGLSHPNLATESGVDASDRNYTASIQGPDGAFDLGSGADGIQGSADDVRGDDTNMHFFYGATNNPFSEQAVIDSTTYTLDLASLPLGDNFPANSDRTVSAQARYGSPNTETAMQQGTFGSEIQRTLGHDDVSTIRYATSGLDEIQGNADDYELNLIYGGISNAPSCDINIAFNAAQTGFAVCQAQGTFVQNSHVTMTSANIFFNPNFNWFFNDNPPCNESLALTPDVWKMISLPCQVGVSTSALVSDVFGDDLGSGLFVDWGMYEYEYTEQPGGTMAGAYRPMALTDELDSTKGYWIKTLEAGKTIDVQGEYNSQMDTDLFIDSAAGQSYGWNLVGMPFRFPLIWADTSAIDPVGNLLSLQQSDPIIAADGVIAGGSGTACSEGPMPTPACKVAQFAFKNVQGSNGYVLLGPTSGTLDKWDAAWVFAGDTDYSLRFNMPVAERTSP